MLKLNPPTTTKQNKKTGPCLAQLSQHKTFECVDNHPNVTTISSSTKRKREKVCGLTPHLSAFGILLSTSESTSCSTSPLFWAAIGVIGAVYCCCILLLLAQWRIKALRRMVVGEETFENMEFREEIDKRKSKKGAKKPQQDDIK